MIKHFKYGTMWKVCIEGMDGIYHYSYDEYTQLSYEEAKRIADARRITGNPYGCEGYLVRPQYWAFREPRHPKSRDGLFVIKAGRHGELLV